MAPTFASNRTKGGYLCGEVSSAFQKCVRRGDVDGALFWGTELDLTGYGEYLWKRMKIIASEDIGLASPDIIPTIAGLYSTWTDLRKKKDTKHCPERLQLVHAILAVTTAAKSRLVDNALIVMYAGARPTREIPDVALDKHTLRGKQKGRGFAHFFSDGCHVENAATWIADPYFEVAKTILRDDAGAPDSAHDSPDFADETGPDTSAAPLFAR